MNELFGFITADGLVVFPFTDLSSWETSIERRDFLAAHPDANDEMVALVAKYAQNHPDYDGCKAIGFFYIDASRTDVMAFEDCVGNAIVSDLLAKLRDSYPRDVAFVENEISNCGAEQ